MGINRGPNLIKDNLVFGYDTGYGVADNNTATRFYPGEPTTNQADTDAKRNWGTHNGAASSTTTAPEKGPGWKKLTITNIYGTNYRLAQFPYLSQADGTSRTYSVEFDVTGLTGYFLFVDGNVGYSQTSISGRGRYSFTTGNVSGNKNLAIFIGKSGTHSNINDVIYYKEYQVEVKGHSTPFTATSRSSTASLIDLKRTADIDLSNVSFDSTGQPTFDGTDDNINQGDVLDTGLQDFTIETVFKRTTNTSASQWIMSKSYAGSAASRYWVDNFWSSSQSKYKLRFGASWANTGHTDYLSNSFIDIDEWYHVVVAVERNNKVFLYINGILDASHDISSHVAHSNSSTLPYRIGSYTAGNQVSTLGVFNGSIPIYRHNNRAFTPDEVKQNFNAYRKRFGI